MAGIYHTVLMPRSISAALKCWHVDHDRRTGRQQVLEAVIKAALVEPEWVLLSLDRSHLQGARDPNDPHDTWSIGLQKQYWDGIEAHQDLVGLPSRGEAVRELLRLGLGLPQPRFIDGRRQPSGSKLIGPHDGEAKAAIVELHQSGLSFGEIGGRLGVSRQYAHQTIKQWRAARAKNLQTEIDQLHDEGKSIPAIAAEVSAPRQYVRKVLARPSPPSAQEPVRWWEGAA